MRVHVVSHTHWDREWYLAAVRFRQYLVALIDDLLDDPPTGGASFLLDGQTVVIDDYVAIRPEREQELAGALRQGVLEAGPWFVLADELIPSGEALVRNLLAGRARLEAIGARAPAVLYCPDSFGHPAALPALAAGFGLPMIIALRGYGSRRWPEGDFAWWTAPDGSRSLLYHLTRGGYENGARLPSDVDGARARWSELRAEIEPRSRLGTALVMNGADHHARQRDLDRAITLLRDAAVPDELHASTLGAFAADALSSIDARSLPIVHGELRDSYGFVWTLQGTFATRAYQKRRNAQMERLLVREAEPWAALAALAGGVQRRPLLAAAWRSLLLCHPHDTLCGCSADAVAQAMDARLEDVHAQVDGIRRDAILDLIGHDRERARDARDSWHTVTLVRNAAPRARGGLARLRITETIAPVKVGLHPDHTPAAPRKRPRSMISGVAAVQVLSRTAEHELTESPRAYPLCDLVSVADVVAWVPEVAPYGVRAFPQTRGRARGKVPNAVRSGDHTLSNGRIAIDVDDDGHVRFLDLAHRRSVDDVVRWESMVDRGDTYTPSIRGPRFAPAYKGARLLQHGPLRGSISLAWTLRARGERVDVRADLTIDADAPFLRIVVRGENSATDHRLRLRIGTDVTGGRVHADAMFGAVTREALTVAPEDARMETPLATAPLHRYVTLFAPDRGATVYADGLAEYEAAPDGAIFLTVLRSVGELSRDDLPERPGHAGWPTPTPLAQCRGPFAAEFALMLHDAATSGTLHAIECTADDVLLPLSGETLRSALAVPNPVAGIELLGEGLAFSCAKQSEDGEWLVLRCVNLTDEDSAGAWRVPHAREARVARLDETAAATPGEGSGAALTVRDGVIAFTAAPRAVVTVLTR
jgi:mannosylglycerate hydrolase